MTYKNKFSLKNKTIVITGATGLIGREFSMACSEYQANLFLIDIDNDSLKKLKDEISSYFPNTMIETFKADVSSIRDLNKAKNLLLDCYEDLHGLVNCHQNKANNFFRGVEEYEEEDWDAVINVNLKGTFFSCKLFGELMKENGGSIVNLASTYSVVAPNKKLYEGTELGCPAAYSASKGGVQALTKYLASYWAHHNIRVNEIVPHGVHNNHSEKFIENFSKLSPLRRLSQSHEVAPALIYLLSDASSYVTGLTMKVDGGWTVW